MPQTPKNIRSQFLGQKLQIALDVKGSEMRPALPEEALLIAGNPIIAALEKTAQAQGLTLRFWLPDPPSMDTWMMEGNQSRLNVYLSRSRSRNYRISKLEIG